MRPLTALHRNLREPFQGKHMACHHLRFEKQGCRFGEQRTRHIPFALHEGHFTQNEAGKPATRGRMRLCRYLQQRSAEASGLSRTIGAAQAEFGKAEVALEDRRKHFRISPHRGDDLVVENRLPAALHLRRHRQQGAGLAGLTREAGTERLGPDRAGDFIRPAELAALHVNQASGQGCTEAVGR